MTLPIGRKPNRAGFTLIELILLAAIIAVLVSISTPLFRRTFTDLELRNTSFNIAKLVSFAQEKAIIEGVNYRLILDVEEGRYYLTKADPEIPGKYKRLKERWGRIFSLPQHIKLKSSTSRITFYPDGHSDKAIITFSSKEKSLKLSVRGKLGYVEYKNK